MSLRCLLALACFASLSVRATASERHDDPSAAAIRQMEEGYIGAWKLADPARIAANFTADGDFINPDGYHAAGRAAIGAFYAQAFTAGYRGSNAGFTPRLSRRVAPGVIVLDGEWFIDGAHEADGKPRGSEHGLATAVLIRTRAGWRIVALREQSSGTKISN